MSLGTFTDNVINLAIEGCLVVDIPSILTTVAVDPRGLGRRSAELILERLRNPETDTASTIAPVRLVVRESSCPPSSP